MSEAPPYLFAEVIIPLALPKNYTWSVPESMKGQLEVGCRVEVSLGKKKKYAGIVKKIHQSKPEAFEPKDILNILDASPVIHPAQLQLWEWIAGYYMCSEGEVMAAALPSHFKLSSETILIYNEEAGDDFSSLDHEEYLLAEALLMKKELKITEAQQVLDSAHVYPVIKRLIDKKFCFVWETLKDTYVPRKETFIHLGPEYDQEEKLAGLMNNWGRAPKQLELLLSFLHLQKTEGDVSKSALLKKSGATEAQLKGLIEKKILFAEKRTIDRITYLPRDIRVDFELSPVQRQALEKVRSSFTEKGVCLLHGITSSGKTLIYIKLIEELIRKGRQVLYLLPEIALTSQIIRRLQQHFGGYIGIYHSKFSQNERVEIWNRIRSGEMKVILGARSSLFLPFMDLSMIIVDEEQDASFKQQDPAPRYNARDAAIYYAALVGAKVLLGSATPSVESYYNAVNGKYGLAELSERFGAMPMPLIELADTKELLFRKKRDSMLTASLKEAIRSTTEKGKQVILFQNRRGYSPYQICEVCGWIPHCRYCDVSLNFHKQSNKLHCHYCGTVYPLMTTCLACGSDKFMKRNFGTEKIEEQLQEEFPDMKIARMDIDSVRGKQAHDRLIQLFEQHRIEVLVGTQMVVKGLDFDEVQLVGIVDADSLMNFADFRVNERAFQLMEQVSGRSGRKGEPGRVIIQVANMRHPLLPLISSHDYRGFYEQELSARKRFFYPPFSRLIQMVFKHTIKEVVDAAAARFAAALQPSFGTYMIGPAEPVVNRVRNQYLMELLFKLPKDGALIASCKKAIHEQVAILHNEKKFRSVVMIADVDPL